ncbi:MAG TPA: ATP cone domain-containing protein, partial [Clostridia bacterium]|nr:ATP cone domain-containing protein [Clostridia bacterium]
MYQVTKRDGNTVSFDLSKISIAIQKAFDAAGRSHNPDILDLLAL